MYKSACIVAPECYYYLHQLRQQRESTMYTSINDAKNTLDNSGWVDAFPLEVFDAVYCWMYQNDKTADEAAEYFNVK